MNLSSRNSLRWKKDSQIVLEIDLHFLHSCRWLSLYLPILMVQIHVKCFCEKEIGGFYEKFGKIIGTSSQICDKNLFEKTDSAAKPPHWRLF